MIQKLFFRSQPYGEADRARRAKNYQQLKTILVHKLHKLNKLIGIKTNKTLLNAGWQSKTNECGEEADKEKRNKP